jgi:CBS domain-containing protein
LGGRVYPRALGVGYETIEALLRGELPLRETLLLVIVKWTIWAFYLGSGTSGGVLAPLLMIGASLGAAVSSILPSASAGFWPLIAMGAALGGTMRSPLTGVVFAVELTGQQQLALPLLVASTVAHGFTVLFMRRSILTEKVARRGFHVTREYAIDPLDVLFVRDVMETSVVGLPATTSPSEIRLMLDETDELEPIYPVVDGERLVGVATPRLLKEWAKSSNGDGALTLGGIASAAPVTAFPDEPLRDVVHRMARTGHTGLPVLARHDSARLVGLLSLTHTLEAKRRHLEEEQRRERVLHIGIQLPQVIRNGRRSLISIISGEPTKGSTREESSKRLQ